MSHFSLEKQYQLYLQRVGLSESRMHPEQKIQTKRAFMGACGQMLVLLRDEIGALEEDEAIDQMKDMYNQVESFWLKETNQTN